MKRFLCLFLTLVLLATSIVIPTTAYAEETNDLTQYTEYVYDENNDLIDYSKVVVFKNIDEVYSYLYSQNLDLVDSCEQLNKIYFVLDEEINSFTYGVKVGLGAHIFNIDMMQTSRINNNKKLFINGKERRYLYKLALEHVESDEYAEKYYDAVHSALNEMNLTGLSDYAKAEAILSWVATNIRYDANSPACNNFVKALVEREGICVDYTSLVNLFCSIVGIESVEIAPNFTHASNAIKIDGIWYFTDATWSIGLESARTISGIYGEDRTSKVGVGYGRFKLLTQEPYIVLLETVEYEGETEEEKGKNNKQALEFYQNVLKIKPDDDKALPLSYPVFIPYNVGKTEIKPFTEDLLNNPNYTNSSELNLGYIDYDNEKVFNCPPCNIADSFPYTYKLNRTAYYTPDDILVKNAQNYSCVLNNYSGDKYVKISEKNYKVDQYGNPTDELCEISEERIIEKGQSIPNKSHNLIISEEKHAEFCTDPTSVTYKCTDCDYCVEVVTLGVEHDIKSKYYLDGVAYNNYFTATHLAVNPSTCTENGNIKIYNYNSENIYIEEKFICINCGYNTSIKTPNVLTTATGHNITTELLNDGTVKRSYCTNTKSTYSVKGTELWQNDKFPEEYKKEEGSAVFDEYNGHICAYIRSNNNPSVSITFNSKETSVEDLLQYIYFETYELSDSAVFRDKEVSHYEFKDNQWQIYKNSNKTYTPISNANEIVSITTEGDYTTITVKNSNGFDITTSRTKNQPLSNIKNILDNCFDNNSSITFTCDSPCDYEEITELKHNYELIDTVASTCQTQGYNEYTCTYCGDTYREPLELADHTPIYKGYQEPTCTTSGHTDLTICSVCGEILNEGEEIAPLGHSYTCTTIPPTCGEEGYDLYTCERCGDSYKNNIIAPTGEHNIVIDKAVPVTCTTDGLTEGSHCSVCNQIIVKQETITKTGHSYKNYVTKATLTSNGSIVNKCSVCGAVKSSTAIAYPKTITLSTTSYTYDGKSHTPAVTVKDSTGKTLVRNTDYVLKYASGRTNAGTYYVDVVFQGNYSGTKRLTFKINPISATKCTATLNTTATYYNGSVKTPTVTVKCGSTTLKKGTDYTVSYASGRKLVGRYAVKVTYKGNYSGTKTLYFNIIPRGTTVKKITTKSKGFTVQWNTQKTQTTGYQIQYSTSSKFTNAKTITMPKSTYSAKTITGLTGNKKYYVRIRTYRVTKFGGKNYNIYSPWSSAKTVTTMK